MDIECIYLDNPTNILVNINGDMSEEDFYTALCQQESLRETEELTNGQLLDYMTVTFNNYYGTGERATRHLTSFQSVYNSAAGIMLQAAGRICRTQNKGKDIYIMLSRRAARSIAFSDIGELPMTVEFRAVVDTIQERTLGQILKSRSLKDITAVNDTKSNRTGGFIRRLMPVDMDEDWTSENRDTWKNLRSFSLRCPGLNKSDISAMIGTKHVMNRDEQFIARNGYIDLIAPGNTYRYTMTGDYTGIKTYVNGMPVQTGKGNSSLTVYTMSEDDARLQQMLDIPYKIHDKDGREVIRKVRDYFMDNHMAVSFPHADLAMSPPVYNNIYKGALGETIGRLIINSCLNIDLEEIEDLALFETFDFSYMGQYFFDFKHWKNGYIVDKDNLVRKIFFKLRKCGGKVAFIINIISDRKRKPRLYKGTYENRGLTIWEIPYLYHTPEMELNTDALDAIMGAMNIGKTDNHQ
ncbi:MAG: hypothetical protein LUD51_05240 [Clostridia bacterium]|nr:hypothetical protein [Clostridia bacterium]